jgi:hypothetical protein
MGWAALGATFSRARLVTLVFIRFNFCFSFSFRSAETVGSKSRKFFAAKKWSLLEVGRARA